MSDFPPPFQSDRSAHSPGRTARQFKCGNAEWTKTTVHSGWSGVQALGTASVKHLTLRRARTRSRTHTRGGFKGPRRDDSVHVAYPRRDACCRGRRAAMGALSALKPRPTHAHAHTRFSSRPRFFPSVHHVPHRDQGRASPPRAPQRPWRLDPLILTNTLIRDIRFDPGRASETNSTRSARSARIKAPIEAAAGRQWGGAAGPREGGQE